MLHAIYETIGAIIVSIILIECASPNKYTGYVTNKIVELITIGMKKGQ